MFNTVPVPDYMLREISQELQSYHETEYIIKGLTGYNLNSLKDLFLLGYTLKRPDIELTPHELELLLAKEKI